MFELLAQVDPLAALLGGLWLFAAGLFPVGFMLGSSCSCHCGEVPCNTCTVGELPETLTVAFSGLAQKVPAEDLVFLSFTSCYGSGATAKVTAPGGDPEDDRGPISKIELTDGGSGYAKLGRVAPALTISGGSGTGATFTPTLSSSQDACKLDVWSLASVAASGGTGYVSGETLTITASDGDTQVQAASAKLYLDRSEPTITLSGTATTTVQLADNGDNTWRIAGVTVTDGGSGWTQGAAITFNTDGADVTVFAATATARVVHDAPENAVLTIITTGGSGAVLEPVWELLPEVDWPAPNRKLYRLASVTVVNGGSGYADEDEIVLSFASSNDGTILEQVYSFVFGDPTGVGPNGEIEQVYVGDEGTGGGEIVGSRTDSLHSVNITGFPSGGSYYKDDPGARRVTVTAGGSYYREDATAPPYVAAVTVGVEQVSPSEGTGAELSVVIDDDPESETFGEITAVNIDDGGDGYLAHELVDSCLTRFNGRSIVVRKNYPFWKGGQCCTFFPGTLVPDECTYGYTCAKINGEEGSPDDCTLEAEAVRVEYRGPSQPMTVFLMLHQGNPAAYGLLTASELVADCSTIDITAYGSPLSGPDVEVYKDLPPEATAHVTAGGTYEEPETCCRISSDDMNAVHVELTWNGETFTHSGGFGCGFTSGIYIPGGERTLASGLCTTGVLCSHGIIVSGASLTIVKIAGCGFRWRATNVGFGAIGTLRVAKTRVVRQGFTYPAFRCIWDYPVRFPDDACANGGSVPSSVELGTPVFSTESFGCMPPVTIDPANAGVLGADPFCTDPGPPTITISVLP